MLSVASPIHWLAFLSGCFRVRFIALLYSLLSMLCHGFGVSAFPLRSFIMLMVLEFNNKQTSART